MINTHAQHDLLINFLFHYSLLRYTKNLSRCFVGNPMHHVFYTRCILREHCRNRSEIRIAARPTISLQRLRTLSYDCIQTENQLIKAGVKRQPSCITHTYMPTLYCIRTHTQPSKRVSLILRAWAATRPHTLSSYTKCHREHLNVVRFLMFATQRTILKIRWC